MIRVLFADSSAVNWTGTLTLAGTLKSQTVRFGTSASALTADQLQKIDINGSAVKLDAEGYLRYATTGVYLIVR